MVSPVLFLVDMDTVIKTFGEERMIQDAGIMVSADDVANWTEHIRKLEEELNIGTVGTCRVKDEDLNVITGDKLVKNAEKCEYPGRTFSKRGNKTEITD